MPRFSKFHRLNAKQSQLDFVDIDNDEDTAVYVDPYAIEIRDDIWAAEASQAIRVFFLEVLQSLIKGDTNRAINLMSNLSEPKETFLRVSTGKPKGRGVGRKQALQLVKSIKNSPAFKTGLLSDLSEMALYVENVDRDKISDLTTNIIRSQLIKYTQDQCNLFSIPLHDYNGPPLWDAKRKNWVSQIVQLPLIGEDPVLLVPKYIVRRTLSLNSSEFYQKQITDFLVAENLRAHSGLVQVLASGEPKVFKKDVREANPKSEKLIADIVAVHPELLEFYKNMAKKSGMMVNFQDDDPSVAEVCLQIIASLKDTKSGVADADRYHMLAMGALTTCFYPDLILPRKEWEINGGRKRIDIVYTNSANEGFFAQRRDAGNTAATMAIVECKNYSGDLWNPELDQLYGRFDNNRGRFGILTCRYIEKTDTAIDRCRDFAKGGNGYIIVLTDADLIKLLEAKSVDNWEAMQDILHLKFRELIA